MPVKDKYPQMLKALVTESAINTFTEQTIPTPVQRHLSNGKALVMSILRVDFQITTTLAGDDADSFFWSLTTKSQSDTIGVDNVDALAAGRISVQLTTSGAVLYQSFWTNELHGVLVGNSNLFLGVKGSSQTAVQSMGCSIIYRLVEVSSNELIGLIA